MGTGRRQATRSTEKYRASEASAAPSQFRTAARSPHAADSPGSSTLIAVSVNPYVVHCRWELAAEDLEKAKKILAVDHDDFWPALQFFEVTADRTRSSPSFSVDVHLSARNWFVRCCSPEHMYRVDLVIRNEDGSFAIVARSNSVRTPPAATSEDIDLDWMPIRLPPTVPQLVTPAPVPQQRIEKEFEGPAAAIETPLPVLVGVVKEVPGDEPVPHADMHPGLLAQAAARPSSPPTDQQNKATEPSQVQREMPATRERRTEDGLPTPRTSETKPDKVGDLTELDESSFLSGISSTRN